MTYEESSVTFLEPIVFDELEPNEAITIAYWVTGDGIELVQWEVKV